MNTIWTKEGLANFRDLIGSGEKLKITEFVLSGSKLESGLTNFTGDSETGFSGFPSKVYKGEVKKSYVSEDGFLTVFCEVSDFDESFFYNGIGIVFKDRTGKDLLLGVSLLEKDEYKPGDTKKIWLQFPVFVDNEDSIFKMDNKKNYSSSDLEKAIETHNNDINSHPYLSDDIASVSEVVKLELFHRFINAEFELFKPKWTLIKPGIFNVSSVDSGNLIIELNTAEGIEEGHYVIHSGDKKEEIEITKVIDSKKIKIKNALTNQYNEFAVISKTSINEHSKGEVTLTPGDIYISKKIDLGKSKKNHSIIIRRTTSGGKIDLFVKETGNSSYTKVPHKWTRKINDTYTDYEYELLVEKEFIFKLAGKESDLKIDHIICAGDQSVKDQGVPNPPDKPVNKFPSDKANNIKETPTLEIEKYTHPLGTELKYIQFQLTTKKDFSVVIHDSGKLPSGTTYSVGENVLFQNTRYYWRVRVEDVDGGISEFSDPFSFVTERDFEYIRTPQNIYPANGQTGLTETPTLSASEFSVYGTSDYPVKSQWRIRKSDQTWSNPAHDSGEVNSLTSYNVPDGVLNQGETRYYFQVRYKGAKLGWSEWSQETMFETKDDFSGIVGIALVQPGGGAGVWKNIDKDGNNISPDKSFWNHHSIYSEIKDVVVDGQKMIKIPKFYYKVGKLTSGANANKKAWLISSKPEPGYSIHPAFLDGNRVLDYFYVGKYEAVDDPFYSGTKAASLKNKKPLASMTIRELEKRSYARNKGGVNGFHLMNFYEIAAIQFLCLIEVGTSDVQSAIGLGHVNASSTCLSGSSNAVWRGIHELWGNVYHSTPGFEIDGNGQILLQDTYGILKQTGKKSPKSGWIVSFDDSFDSVFLPKVIGPKPSASYPDYYNYHGANGRTYTCLHGGYFYETAGCTGLFQLEMTFGEKNYGPHCGGRLVKK